MHAAKLAETLGMKKTIIPLLPGNFSAIGCILADVRYDYVRTLVKNILYVDIEKYNKIYTGMKNEAIENLYEEGYSKDEIIFDGVADMRYSGQAWELSISVPIEVSSKEDFEKIRKCFEKTHKKMYDFTMDDEDVVIVNLRLSAIGVTPKLASYPEALQSKKIKDDALKYIRDVFFEGEYRKVPIYDRKKLQPGNELIGPAIIEEYASSTVVPSGKIVYIDEYKNIIIINKE